MSSIQKDASALLLPPTRATHGRCVLCQCVGELWRGVHKCARLCFGVHRLCTCVGFGCARCAQCAECRWALTAVFSECFAKCAHICRMCRTLSQNSTRLGSKSTDRRSVRVSGKNSSGQDFSLGSKSEPWRRIRELFPSGAVRGRIWPDLAKSGAPAAILINAYSGDFCHPVLSNALAQEPLVYHSGTRELFSDIFGTFSEISTFSTFWHFLRNSDILRENMKKWFSHMRTLLKNRIYKCSTCAKTFHARKTILQMCKRQMCKCANVQKTDVHKMRKSAAQIIFQMQKLQFAQICKCTFHNSRKTHFCRTNIFSNANFCVWINFCVNVLWKNNLWLT